MATEIGYAVSTIDDLKAINSDTRVHGYIKSVTTKNSWYIFNATSTLSADDDLVIKPTLDSDVGRWIKMYQTSTNIKSTITVTTSSLAIGGSYSNSFSCSDSFILTNLSTNYPARIRIYLNQAYANADASRTVDTELTGEHGCLVESVTTSSNLNLDLSPTVVIYTTTTSPSLYLTLQNNDTVIRTITLSMIIKNI